jgi:hypothetical protein
MSTHPNVILMAVLTPDNTSRKTMRYILEYYKKDYNETMDELKIGNMEYTAIVMESDYEDGYQISANEGDIVFLNW